MERIVIVGYRPIKGMEGELKELLKSHWKILNKQQLVSNREPLIMEAGDGSIIEAFGWKSKEAIDSAHTNPIVQKIWGKFANVCEYIPISDLAESKKLFSEFTPIN